MKKKPSFDAVKIKPRYLQDHEVLSDHLEALMAEAMKLADDAHHPEATRYNQGISEGINVAWKLLFSRYETLASLKRHVYPADVKRLLRKKKRT